MNPIIFALRHPITILVAMFALVGGSVLAVSRSKVDIFPELNLPVIYVAQPYGGMDPAQMEGLLTNYYEYHFLYIAGIHHVESKNIQGVAVMRLYFHPGTDMAQAMAETINYVNRSRAFMPPGTVSPFVMRFDTGSVPVGYLVVSAKGSNRTIGEMQRMALFDVRPIFASLPGVSAPPPFGGSQRTIVLKVDPKKLDAKQVSLQEVIRALDSGNTISPSGNVYLQDQMPIVRVNAVAANPQELGNIPVKPGSSVCLRDIGEIRDATDIPTGYALVNGKRTVYMLVTKRSDASTLAVVNAVKENLPRMQKALPEDIDIRFEFDQSPYVTRAIWGVGTEGALGAILTGLMVLLFLRDWRSVIVVVLNIPLALLGAVIALWLTGQTINLMTLGGLALAVGILVDEATVEVENIHTQMERTGNIAWAVRLGNAETAVPRLLAMLCILAVFIPSFFMEGAARALFVPLSLAVGFSMVASYILSSTLVPVLSVWLLRHYHVEGNAARAGRFSFVRFRGLYARVLSRAMPLRWLTLAAYVAVPILLVAWWTMGHPGLGTEIFPSVDSGQFQLRLRTPTGTRIQRTEEMTQVTLDTIQEVVGPDRVGITLAYVGVVPPSYPINNVYLWTSGPEEAILRVAFKRGSGVRVDELKEQLRRDLQAKLEGWLSERLTADGMAPDAVAARIKGIRLSFEPADIVNEVMSFGAPTPVEVAVSGPRLAENRAFAEKIHAQLAKIPALRDLQYMQTLDYPTVDVKVNREKLGRSGGSVKGVTDSVIAATSSSRYMVPMYWPDPNTGIGFQVQVEIPVERMTSEQEIGLLRIHSDGDGPPLRVRDIAEISRGTMPGEYDRYNMRRLVSMTANIQGEDLGRVADQLAKAVAAAGDPPRGVHVDVRGQVVPMRQMFRDLSIGLVMGAAVIFLLLMAYFQSLRLALVAVTTVPAVIAGVAAALVVTGTTLNIQSFMGAIMAIGVAVANAILLVTFAERARRGGAAAVSAAVDGAEHRLRPILMTSCAMIAGMVPMALALGEGGEQVAPLGRAVIGGLIAATLATLFILPSLFAIVMGWGGKRSPSLDPSDPDSAHHGPPPSVASERHGLTTASIQGEPKWLGSTPS
ncbi:MAG: efflux RND transporter permease subunit [Gemmataceae bacterium]|nr:efflux RND transporter permease subunit [Gemmataceae bacterium]